MDENKLALIPIVKDVVPTKDLFCYATGDPVDYSRCRAEVRDFTKTNPCQIRQCKELVQESDENVMIGEEFYKLGPVHKGKMRNDQEIVIYKQVVPVEKEFVNLSNDIKVREIDIEDLYFGLNENYRNKLKKFTDLYRGLVDILQSQKQTLLNRLNILLQDETRLMRELKVLEDTLAQLHLNYPVNDQIIQELTQQFKKLEKELGELREQKEVATLAVESCTMYFQAATEHAKNETDSLIKYAKSTQKNIYDDNPVFMENEKARDDLKANEQIRKKLEEENAKKATEILNLRGLYVLIRIRCDVFGQILSRKSKLDYEATPGSKYIEIDGKKISERNDQRIELWDDRKNGTECNKDMSLIEMSMPSREKCQANLDMQNKDKKEYFDIMKAFHLFIAENKKKIQDDFEKTEFKIQKAEETKLIAEDKLRIWKSYHESRINEFEAKYVKTKRYDNIPDDVILPYTFIFKPKREDPETFSGNMNKVQIEALWAKKNISPEQEKQEKLKIIELFNTHKSFIISQYNFDYHALENFARDEIKSYKFQILSGAEYIKTSSLQFIRKQEPGNMIDNITILNIGGSGTGKTTTSKALLKFIYLEYVSRFSEDLVTNKCEITVDFNEVYYKDGMIKLAALSTTPGDNQKYLYPYLVQLSERGHEKTEVKQNYLCGIEVKNVDNPPPKECTDLKTGQKAYDVMHNLLKLDFYSETNRETKYTPTNPSGSSRGIKIITLQFFNRSTKKMVNINLIDPPGFENHESKEKLIEFYKTKIMLAKGQDANYLKLNVKTDNEVNRFVTQIETETVFIRNTLTYLENLILKYKELRNDKTLNENTFHQKMNQIEHVNTMNQNTTSKLQWATKDLNLFPQNSTVIVIGAFKGNVQSENEVYAANETMDFLQKII